MNPIKSYARVNNNYSALLWCAVIRCLALWRAVLGSAVLDCTRRTVLRCATLCIAMPMRCGVLYRAVLRQCGTHVSNLGRKSTAQHSAACPPLPRENNRGGAFTNTGLLCSAVMQRSEL